VTNHSVWNLLKPDSIYPSLLLREALLELAEEGLTIRSDLDAWYVDFTQWSVNTATPENNSQSILSTIYFHGISIYLSGIFDYRSQFNDITAPTISQSVVQNHVNAILTKSKTALQTTNLGGVLFLFPLRVAGARVITVQETESILEMLREISSRSFVVADAFTVDLKYLWQLKGIY
jgi:hypothetical protein